MLVDIINEQVKTAEIHLIVVNNTINSGLLKNISKQAKIHYIKRKPKTMSIFRLFFLNLLTVKIKPDVIHCHAPTLIRLLIFRHLLKYKTVLTLHSTLIPRKNLACYDRLIAISETVKEHFQENHSLPVTTIYNGVYFHEKLEKTDYKYRTFRLVQVGRMVHNIKGHHILIQALNVLVNIDRIKNISLDFIGDGESKAYLEKQAAKSGLNNHIRFIGPRSRKQIYKALKDYQLLVHPSLQEGFGLSIVEAMSLKVPLLVSNIEGTMEIIDRDRLGYSFESNNYLDCAEQIKLIIAKYDSSELSDKLELAYAYAKQHYSIQNTAQEYIHEYRSLNIQS